MHNKLCLWGMCCGVIAVFHIIYISSASIFGILYKVRIWGNGIPSVFNVNMRSKKLNTLCIFKRFISTAPPHSLQLKRRKLGTNFALFWDKVTIGICGWQFNFEKEILEDTFFFWKLLNLVGDEKTDNGREKSKMQAILERFSIGSKHWSEKSLFQFSTLSNNEHVEMYLF